MEFHIIWKLERIVKVIFRGYQAFRHNLMLDLCFVYHNFYRSLPKKYTEFKANVHEIFPLIIDTKLVAQNSSKIQVGGTILILSRT
jgi:hypothetical protein